MTREKLLKLCDYLECNDASMEAQREAAAFIRKTLAQPEQEPVAWTLTEELEKGVTTTSAHLWFTDPQNSSWTPLYTTPPQRKPLTENEFLKLVERDYKLCGECFYAYQIKGALAHSSDKNFEPVDWVWRLKTMIEAAHGIKGDA